MAFYNPKRVLDLGTDTCFGSFNASLDFFDGCLFLQRSDATRSFCNIPFGFTIFDNISLLDTDIARVGKDISWFYPDF